MTKFRNEHVITFRVGSEAERLALDRVAESRGKSRSDLLRAVVRRLLLADLGLDREEAKP